MNYKATGYFKWEGTVSFDILRLGNSHGLEEDKGRFTFLLFKTESKIYKYQELCIPKKLGLYPLIHTTMFAL